MSGINLVKKLKDYKAGGSNQVAPKKPGFKLDFSFGNSGGESTPEVSSKDKVLFFLFLVGAGLGYYATIYGKEYTDRITIQKQSEIAAFDAKIASEKSKLQTLKGLAQEADAYEKQMQDLQRKLAVIESLGKNRNLAVRMVDFIVSEMPNNVWLNKMTLDTKIESKVEISGNAMSLQVVSEFMKRLEGAVFFPSWQLIETQKQESVAVGMPVKMGSTDKKRDVIPDARSFLLNARVVPL